MADSLLVGSLNFESFDQVFSTVAETMGGCVRLVPDGEVGPRKGWIFSVARRLANTEGLRQTGTRDIGYQSFPQFGLADGAQPGDVRFEFGYNEEGILAYPRFRELRDQGLFAAGTKFQLAVPTSFGIITSFIRAKDQAALQPVYEQRLAFELDDVLTKVPAEDISAQWDVAVEFSALEGLPWFPGVAPDSVIDQIVHHAALVPKEMELGYHLCYGAAPPPVEGVVGVVVGSGASRHFVEPTDAAWLVRVANAITDHADHPISYIHMPVPIERDDDAYFRPLADLRLRPQTRLYLGLMHAADKVEGAQRRIAAAARYVEDFGVSTECGLANSPTEAIAPLLRAHREVVVPGAHAAAL